MDEWIALCAWRPCVHIHTHTHTYTPMCNPIVHMTCPYSHMQCVVLRNTRCSCMAAHCTCTCIHGCSAPSCPSHAYARSPRMRRAKWMSLGMMVTRLAWMAHRFVCSNSPTKYASEASCSAATADDWNRRCVLKSCAMSRTSGWNGSLRMRSSVVFWYRRMSGNGTVAGRYG